MSKFFSLLFILLGIYNGLVNCYSKKVLRIPLTKPPLLNQSLIQARRIRPTFLKHEYIRSGSLTFPLSFNENFLSSDVGSLELENVGYDNGYKGTILIGDKNLSMLFDTASTDMWVTGVDCQSFDGSCERTKNKFDPNTETFTLSPVREDRLQHIYGKGSVSGVLGFAKVNIAELKIDQMKIGVTTAEQGHLQFQYDGLVGLGLHKDEIADKRNGDGKGYLTLGGLPKGKWKGEWVENKVIVDDDGYWKIKIDKISMTRLSLIKGDFKETLRTQFKNRFAIIDTGSTLVSVPLTDAVAIHQEILDSEELLYAPGFYSIPCDTKIIITLYFNGIPFDINPKDLAGRQINEKRCISGIAGDDTFGSETWLVGDVFLKNVVSVFYPKVPSIQLARSINALKI
ncbi:hypothetical protein G9A89_014303 [Geosiphon pyriformis]|nr:hypothetical protein G9A89_014303 [Geosiphon pyriformis]